MIHGYHVILPAYGFWLPNDPRSSWSEFIRRWELVRFGRAAKSIERREVDDLQPDEKAAREEARATLRYPPVSFTGAQARSIALAFGEACKTGGYTLWALSIMSEHAHLVIARHRFKVEQIANLLKGASTRRLVAEDNHPHASHRTKTGRVPKMWARNQWKVYLDSETAIEDAIRYVEENPIRDGKRPQHWSCVTPFAGLPTGWVNYHG